MTAIDARSEWIRDRARIAREISAGLRDESEVLAQVARALREEGQSRRAAHRETAGWRLDVTTKAVDDGVMPLPAMQRFLDLDARLVGRDPAIEHAKTLIAEGYGIPRNDAFRILRHASSHRNQKLRDVARAVVETVQDDSTTPERTPLTGSD